MMSSESDRQTQRERESEDNLQTFIRDAAVESEQVAHRVRVVVLLLLIVRLFVMRHHEIWTLGETHHFWAAGLMVFGIVASQLILRGVRGARSPTPWLVAFTLLDSFLVTGILFQAVANARPEYVGILRKVDVMFYALISATSSLRLSRIASVGSALSSGIGLGVLVVLDHLWHPQVLAYGLEDIILVYLVLLGCGAIAIGSVIWLKGLLRRSADAALGRERLRQRFGAYVPGAFTSADAQSALGGSRKQVAILFSDIRGFTNYSESLDPAQLVSELNDYFEAVVPAIERHGGVVDKYIGDAVMAVFGLPEPRGGEALAAVQAAVAMQAGLDAHNLVRADKGLPPMRMGVGVHFGTVVAGNVGTDRRLQYTILGDAVNVAARLESATKERGASLLVSEVAWEAAKTANAANGQSLPKLQAFDPLTLRGRSTDTQIFGLPL